jgi:hypothetical protein
MQITVPELLFALVAKITVFFDSPASPALATFPRQCSRLAGEWRVLLEQRPSTLPKGNGNIMTLSKKKKILIQK